MAEELTQALRHRAERGTARGAMAVWARAQQLATTPGDPNPIWRSGPAVALATAALVLLVGIGVPWLTRTLTPDESPAVPNPVPPAVTEPATGLVPTTVPAGPFPEGERVDLLVLSDSGMDELADRYAALASEALDREVRVLGDSSNSAVDALRRIKGSFANWVAEAEIIVFYGRPAGLEYDLPEPNVVECIDNDAMDPEYSGDWTPGTKWEPTPLPPPDDGWPAYRDVLDQIYDEIWRLRDGQPTILRAHDFYNPFLGDWRELGIEAECTAYWELQTQTVKEAAEANGAVFVSLVDIFNGPNHDRDPADLGLLEDAVFPGEEDTDVAAEAIAAIGFELSEPPPPDPTPSAPQS